MKAISLGAACVLTILVLSNEILSQTYWGDGKKIQLEVDSTMILIKFDNELSNDEREQLISQTEVIDGILDDGSAIDGFVKCSLNAFESYDRLLDSLQQSASISLTEPCYRSPMGTPFPVGSRFYTRFTESTSRKQIDSINSIYNVVVDFEIAGMPNVYVLRNTDSSGHRVLDLANLYYELGETYFSEPEFGVRPVTFEYRVYDYYHEYQQHTKKVIGDFNQRSVWDFGGLTDSIVVAVLDDGFDSHEDLPPEKFVPGWDFADNDSIVTPGDRRAHGMACAGIIGASHTTDSLGGLQSSSGIISIAPHTKIMPMKTAILSLLTQSPQPSLLPGRMGQMCSHVVGDTRTPPSTPIQLLKRSAMR